MVKQVLCEQKHLGSKPQDAFKHTPVRPMLLWQGDGRRAGESQKLTGQLGGYADPVLNKVGDED